MDRTKLNINQSSCESGALSVKTDELKEFSPQLAQLIFDFTKYMAELGISTGFVLNTAR